MNANQPSPGAIRLSVCIPTYNFGAFIGATLDSILSQVEADVEVVVLDGGSTDDTPSTVRGFAKRYPCVRYHRLSARGGIDQDLARAVELAQGEYCWLFCADDLMKPGALARMLTHTQSMHDVYVCGFTVCSPDMVPLFDHPILRTDGNIEFDLTSEYDRQDYFARAEATPAFFSFAGSLVVRKARWDQAGLDPVFVGSCWAHAARILQMIPTGLRLKHLRDSYLLKRSENDSFMTAGVANRYALTIDGYHRLAETIFDPDSMEARSIRRTVACEYTSSTMLHAKAAARRAGNRHDSALLDRLAARVYSDGGLKNRLSYAIYRLTPMPVYRFARWCRRALRNAFG